MRLAHLSIMALTAATVFIAGTSAITAQPSGTRAALLRPLSERDQTAARGSGCEISFDTPRGRLIYILDHDVVIRTAAGRTICHITDRQFALLARDGGGRLSCGGLRLTVRQTGRSVGHQESDSASAPATLTATGRGRPWTVRGQWGTAC